MYFSRIYRHLTRLTTILILLSMLAGCGLLEQLPAPAPVPGPAQTQPPALPPEVVGTAITPPDTATPTFTPLPPTETPLPSPTPLPPVPEYLVLLSFDGARPEYFDMAEMPNLESLRETGIYYPDAWVGALENNTPSGHVEMVTGTFPNRNGILGHVWGDLSSGELIQPTTDEAVHAGELSAIVEQSGVPTLAGMFKAKYPDDKVIALSGYKSYAAQALGMGPTDYIVYIEEDPNTGYPRMTAVEGHEPDSDVLTDPRFEEMAQHQGHSNLHALMAAKILVERYQPRALLVNMHETDDRGHTTGGITAPDVIADVLVNTDQGLGELMNAYRAAGIFEKTLWVVTADHGMTPKDHILVADDLFAQLGIAEQRGDRLNLPETRLVNPDRAFEIANKIAASDTEGILAVYVRTENAGLYTYQPAETSSGMVPPDLDATYRYLLDTFATRYSPNIVAMTAEGVVFDKDLSGTGGSHNEINWTNQHVFAIFSGPWIQPGVTSYAPARLVDLAPTIARVMQLDAGDVDGTVLADALTSPLPEDVAAQEALNQWLAPLRDALESQYLR